ncbi:MAG TPA: hypothetical protein VGW38_29585 [Chloroflexota bacterium]|nr:hypothetical protein [Chloroflexota bacterium]
MTAIAPTAPTAPIGASVPETSTTTSFQGIRRGETAYSLLLGLIGTLMASGRYVIGPWYQLYAPGSVSLLEGLATGWEVVYYTIHFPTFLADRLPEIAISSVHYRSFVSLFLSAILYGWTGSAYWSLALVDLVFWWAAAIATSAAAVRLGVNRRAAYLSGFGVATSPLFVSNMWLHVLHLAEFASLPLGLWAALVLLHEHRRTWQLALAWGVLLLFLSLSYNYQWILVPLLAILAGFYHRLGAKRGLLVIAGAVSVYLVSGQVVKTLLTLGVPAEGAGFGEVVAEPGQLVLSQLSTAAGMRNTIALMLASHRVQAMADAYHPAILLIGLVGACTAGPRLASLALTATAMALAAHSLYRSPWTAMTAYPFIYIGVGITCSRVGDLLAGLLTRIGPTLARHSGSGSAGSAATGSRSRLVWYGAIIAIIGVALLTNGDLFGDTSFLHQWWRHYAVVPVY